MAQPRLRFNFKIERAFRNYLNVHKPTTPACCAALATVATGGAPAAKQPKKAIGQPFPRARHAKRKLSRRAVIPNEICHPKLLGGHTHVACNLTMTCQLRSHSNAIGAERWPRGIVGAPGCVGTWLGCGVCMSGRVLLFFCLSACTC